MRFIALEKLINLHDGYTRHYRVEFHTLLLLQREGECFVIEALCPHREHPLEAARIAGEVVQCPLHNYQFSLRSGELLHASDQPCRPLRVWPVVYEDNQVGIIWDYESD
ncbi:MAG: Rieske (2Fe-2S) protein [Gammaproteobacteria bacterium]|nr:Rieske (2Fe-2S) protein [Gammaproteobacteria bacterium]